MIVGADDGFAIENFYARYLAADGWEVIRYAAPAVFHTYYKKNLLNKILFNAGISGIYNRINKELIELVGESKPDVVWFFKGMETYPETLKLIKSQNIFLVNYNPDNPFVFTGKGSGNSNITNSVVLYDLHFTYNVDIQNQLEARSPGKVRYLPFGFDLSQADYQKCENEQEVIKTCFVGNPDIKRGVFINALGDAGVQIDVYGNNWQSFITSPAVTIFPEVRAIEFWKTLRRYRVQLNLVRIHSEDSHNMRTFEVPGAGGIMLAKDTTEHRDFFENKKEIWLYQDVASCKTAILELLNLDAERAAIIRKAARDRSLKSGYQYKDRAAQVSIILKQFVAPAINT